MKEYQHWWIMTANGPEIARITQIAEDGVRMKVETLGIGGETVIFAADRLKLIRKPRKFTKS